MSANLKGGAFPVATSPAQQRGKEQAERASIADMSGNRLGVWLALLSVYVIWGSTYFAIAVAIGPGGFPPFLMASARFLIAGGLLFTYIKLRGGEWPTLRQWGASFLVGCLLLMGGNGLVTFAEKSVASGLAALAIATMPLFAALFAGLWGKWPGKAEWVGLGVGMVGVVLLNLEGDMQANPWAALALIGATASWALGSVWSRYLPLPKGMMASATEMLGGGAAMLVLGLTLGERVTRIPDLQPILAWLYLIVFGSIVAFSAYSYLLQKVRPSLATSYAYVNPVVAVALGVGLGGESVTWIGLVAMPIILIGVGIVVMAKSKG
ncbi:MAG: drug/metabolite exporter YedA [Chloroflexia bacterium]